MSLGNGHLKSQAMKKIDDYLAKQDKFSAKKEMASSSLPQTAFDQLQHLTIPRPTSPECSLEEIDRCIAGIEALRKERQRKFRYRIKSSLSTEGKLHLSRQLMRTIEMEDSIESLSRLTTTLFAESLEPSSLSTIAGHHPLEAQDELNNLLFTPLQTRERPLEIPRETVPRPSYDSVMERIQQTLNA